MLKCTSVQRLRGGKLLSLRARLQVLVQAANNPRQPADVLADTLGHLLSCNLVILRAVIGSLVLVLSQGSS